MQSRVADGKGSVQRWCRLGTTSSDTFRSGDLSPVDLWDNDQFIIEGGSAAHEMRSWIAAYAALSTAGKYKLPVDRYWAVKNWGGGFAVRRGAQHESTRDF